MSVLLYYLVFILQSPIRFFLLVLAGMLLAVIGPFFVGMFLDKQRRQWLCNRYFFPSAQRLYGRSLLIIREHGGLAWRKSSADPTTGKEKVRLDGEERYFEDPGHNMSYFFGVPFGIADERAGVITTPRQCDIAAVIHGRWTSGTLLLSDGAREYVRDLVNIPAGERVVDLTAARGPVPGSAGSNVVSRVKSYVEKSQSVFDRQPAIDYFIWLTSLGVGVGLPYMASKLGATQETSTFPMGSVSFAVELAVVIA